GHKQDLAQTGTISCSFCGVGDGGVVERIPEEQAPPFSGASTQGNASVPGPRLAVFKEVIRDTTPSAGCVKLRLSTMRQRPAFPIHMSPSVLHRQTGTRRPIGYPEAISRLAELLLAHRGRSGRTLIYASGQLDYFAIFGLQEVFRLLGTRNLTGN